MSDKSKVKDTKELAKELSQKLLQDPELNKAFSEFLKVFANKLRELVE